MNTKRAAMGPRGLLRQKVELNQMKIAGLNCGRSREQYRTIKPNKYFVGD